MNTKKANPIPTRFDEQDAKFLEGVVKTTGISQSEIIRRSVRLLRRAAEKERNFAFLLDLVA
jgi:Arc/MetJ-type ribon-helix-helix transcriptional regulator